MKNLTRFVLLLGIFGLLASTGCKTKEKCAAYQGTELTPGR